MEEVNAILRKLDHNGDIGEIRSEIADLIAQCLQQAQGALGYWEKVHFVGAIAAFGSNIDLGQPTQLWLRLCLLNLEKAFVPAEQRNEDYAPRDDQIDALTFEQLMEMLEAVR